MKKFNDLKININTPSKCKLTFANFDDFITDFEFDDIEKMLFFLQQKLAKYDKCVFVCFGDTNEDFDENPEFLITSDCGNAVCYFESIGCSNSKFNLFTFESYEQAIIYISDLSETSSIN